MGKAPPARSQENWAQQGQAPVDTLRKKPTQRRNATICLLCLCPGMMFSPGCTFNTVLSKLDAPKTANCFTGMDELLGALWDAPHASNTPHAIHPQIMCSILN